MKKAEVLWFTGLSGAGKSTLANALQEKLVKEGKKAKLIDGDDVRRVSHQHLGFTPRDIHENNRFVLELCLKLLSDFDFILVSVISPFQETRENARKRLGEHYHEVYVKCSLKEVSRRDAKGLYQKALKGEIPYFVGIDPRVLYEEPQSPELILETDHCSKATVFKKLFDYADHLIQVTTTKQKMTIL